jgi:tetratricopeptide (TPR) repeat protein
LGRVAQEKREYEAAREYYQQSLQLKIEFGDRYSQAGTYGQLGNLTEELREYEAAHEYYQQALQIYLEYGDRYSQASTDFHLGQVLEELGDLESAKAHYLQDLQITKEFNDEHGLGISLQNLARFYRATQNEGLLAEVAAITGVTVEEMRQRVLAP